MKNIILFIFFTLIACNCIHAQKPLNKTILFDNDKWELTKEHKDILSNLLSSIKQFNQYQIAIEGHTDNIGDSLYNIELSRKRSNSVYKYLIRDDISQTNVNVISYGENKPRADNKTTKGRKLNRRTEIIVQEIKPEKTLKDLYAQLLPDSQIFCINPDKDTVIVGKKGSILYFRANSFNLNSDTLDECIKIIIKERFKKSEMFLDNLTTISGEDIIISQSMLYIDARYKGIRVELKKDITVMTPTDTIIPNMLLFIGERDTNDNMNWTLTNDTVTPVFAKYFYPCPTYVPPPIDDFTDEALDAGCWNLFSQLFRSRKSGTPSEYDKFNAKTSDSVRTIQNANDTCEMLKDITNDIFIEKFGDFGVEKLKDIPRADMKYYLFNRRLGWTNTDWMMKIKNKITFKLHIVPQANMDVKLGFKNYRTILPLATEDCCYYYKGVPFGYEAWLIALKYENGLPMLAIKEITINNEGVNELEFKVYSISELKTKLQVLDL